MRRARSRFEELRAKTARLRALREGKASPEIALTARARIVRTGWDYPTQAVFAASRPTANAAQIAPAAFQCA